MVCLLKGKVSFTVIMLFVYYSANNLYSYNYSLRINVKGTIRLISIQNSHF